MAQRIGCDDCGRRPCPHPSRVWSRMADVPQTCRPSVAYVERGTDGRGGYLTRTVTVDHLRRQARRRA